MRATIAGLVALVSLLSVAAPAQGQTDPRARRDEVQRQQVSVNGELDVLRASSADVRARLSGLQSRVAAAEAALAAAQAAAADAATALTAAIDRQAQARREVEERRQRLREIAVDAYVNADTRTADRAVSLERPSADVDARTLRLALAGFRADQDGLALRRLDAAEAQLAGATAAARSAADAAAARQADAQSQADSVRAARDQQSSYADAIERRLDDRLAEADALRSLDRTLSDQIAAQERALAALVTPAAKPGAAKPPPPAGTVVVVPPPPANPDLVTTHGITVARSIADRLGAMIDAAKANGIDLTGSGYRSYDSQVALRRQNCGPTAYDIYERPPSECTPPTARPGTSNHERGLAVDVAAGAHAIVSHSDPGFVWLDKHASAYGFHNLDSEPWHWSVDGL